MNGVEETTAAQKEETISKSPNQKNKRQSRKSWKPRISIPFFSLSFTLIAVTLAFAILAYIHLQETPSDKHVIRATILPPENTKLYVADINLKPNSVEVGQVHELLQWDNQLGPNLRGRQFDASEDGQRFLLLEHEDDFNAPVNLVVNWIEEVKKK